MPYIRIMVHFVWTTKNRIPFLSDEIRSDVFNHIQKSAENKGIRIIELNGYKEHVHALISLGSMQAPGKIIQQLKGESSFWINKNKLTKLRFEWQDDFYAVSIGESHFEVLREYIRNQETHHNKVLVKDELDKLIAEYNLQYIRD